MFRLIVAAEPRKRPGVFWGAKKQAKSTREAEALTMLRRHEAEAEREEADAASVASSRMAGQRRSNTRWLRYTDPG
jgi:hypothetical protein